MLHQVVLNGGKGRIAFQTHDKGQADAVARSYPGSIVRPDPATATAAATDTTAAARDTTGVDAGA